MKTIDLHVHSNFSDGTFSPEELIAYAVKKQLSAIALTDHDTTAGIAPAVHALQKLSAPLDFIPGTELSVEYDGQEIHLVGLFIDCNNKKLTEQMELFVTRRRNRNLEMIERFVKNQIPMTLEDLNDGNPDTVITRAHFARHLVSAGIAKDGKEAFAKYLGKDSPYYVPRVRMNALDGISLILQAGGVPILAHPLHYHMEEKKLRTMISKLKEHGLMGIEVKYSNHTRQDEYFAARLAKEYDLLPSGGSDFHGSNKPAIDLGCGRGNLFVPYEYYEQLKKHGASPAIEQSCKHP